MSKEFLFAVRDALDAEAQARYNAACLKIDEEMKSLEEVRDRFGSLDNYHIPDTTPFRLHLRLREERLIIPPTYLCINRVIGDEIYFLTFHVNLRTRLIRNMGVNFHGKPLVVPRYDSVREDAEDATAVYPALGYDVCYRDEEGVFRSLRRTNERRKVIYDGDTPYLVTDYTHMVRPIFTADEKRQIVRCMNLWTKEQKVYVFPCPAPKEEGPDYLNHPFMFRQELYAFGEGRKIYHIPSNRLVAEISEDVMMRNVRAVASDGLRLFVSQFNERGDTEILHYDLSR